MKILKSQIALLYFPELADSPPSAIHRLRNWIKRNEHLNRRLQKTGYKPRTLYFTKSQVSLIFEYLGEPDKC